MRALRLSPAAETDIAEVLRWTARQFGSNARTRFEALVLTALRDVVHDPLLPGSLDRREPGAGIRSYHFRFSRERGRTGSGIVRRPQHLLLYRALHTDVLDVGRVLHDRWNSVGMCQSGSATIRTDERKDRIR